MDVVYIEIVEGSFGGMCSVALTIPLLSHSS